MMAGKIYSSTVSSSKGVVSLMIFKYITFSLYRRTTSNYLL